MRPAAGSTGSRSAACRWRSRPARRPARPRSGPPPTRTKVIHSRRRSGSASRSAASNAIRIRRRISVASSMVLRPGRVRRPVVVPEVAVPGAGRDDERVVREVEAVRGTGPRGRPGRCPSPRPAGPSCCAACGRSSAAAARSRPATGRPSPPGRAAAGTGGGSAGRPASRPPGRRALRSSRAAYRPPNPPPTTTTRCGRAVGAGSGGRAWDVIESNANAWWRREAPPPLPERALGSSRRPGGARRVRRGYLSCEVASTAWAAARRATGTRNGEQDT